MELLKKRRKPNAETKMLKKIKKMEIKRKVFFDELDEFIIRQIILCYKNKREVDTWYLSKLYVSLFYKKDIENIYSIKKVEVDGIYRKIKRKIIHYTNHGVISVSKNGGGKAVYNFNIDAVTISKHKFIDGYKECMILRL